MKKMIILAVAMMIMAVANAKSVETEAFSALRVNVPADVRVVRGNTYGVSLKANSREVERAVRLRVVKGTLYIDTRDLDALPDDTRLRVTITVPADCAVKAGSDMVINSERVNNANHDLAAIL